MLHSLALPPHDNYFEDVRLMRQFLDHFPAYLSRQYQLEVDEYEPNFDSAGPLQYTFIGGRNQKLKIESLRIAAERMRKFSFAMKYYLLDEVEKDPASGIVKKTGAYWFIIEIDYGRDVWYPCPW